MSQHSDLLTHEICRGIKHGLSATEIVNEIQELLMVLEYDEYFTDLTTVKKHAYTHARGMLAQKDGLYGVATHAKLDKFCTELWCQNQWLTA